MSESGPIVDPHRKQRITWFVTMNLGAIIVAALVFWGILEGHSLNLLFQPLLDGIFEFKVVAVVIAMSPLFASLLVGMAYAQRALKRKRTEAAAALVQPSPSS